MGVTQLPREFAQCVGQLLQRSGGELPARALHRRPERALERVLRVESGHATRNFRRRGLDVAERGEHRVRRRAGRPRVRDAWDKVTRFTAAGVDRRPGARRPGIRRLDI